MNEALQKTLELLLIILIGYLLQRKLPDKQNLKGIKTLILSVALPATIFMALLKINLESSLLFLPLLALAFNLVMLGVAMYVLPLIFESNDAAAFRTRGMLLPSLAPGLSCFPFIIAYLGEDQLAIAALADVGNKFFGLILLFILATYWYRKRSAKKEQISQWGKLKSLLISLGSEPINLVIAIGIVLLMAGFSLADMPVVVQRIFSKFSMMMVPLILLFIGLSVRIGLVDFFKMVQLLTWRSGMAFLLSGLTLMLIPEIAISMALLMIVFPQSACSFWPFAHMCTVSNAEEKDGQTEPTFDLGLAINMLACSLPYSTCIIISIFYFGEVLIDPFYPIMIGIIMIIVAMLPRIIQLISTNVLNRTLTPGLSKARRPMNPLNEEVTNSIGE